MNKALVIIDLQKGFITNHTQKLPAMIRNFILRHKENYDLIIFTQYVNHLQSNFVKNLNYSGFIKKEQNDFVKEIKEFTNKDNVFTKDTYGSFVNNKVSNIFKKYKIGEVDLAGIDTENCVLTFARDAFDRGYKVNVLKELCGSHSNLELHRAALKIIKNNIGTVR